MDDIIQLVKNNRSIYLEYEKSKQRFVTFIINGYLIFFILGLILLLNNDNFINNFLNFIFIFSVFNVILLKLRHDIHMKYLDRKKYLNEYIYLKMKVYDDLNIKKILIDNFKYTSDNDCIICLNNNNDIKLSCNHIYCSDCISIWLKKENKCPLCRTSIICDNTINDIILKLSNKN